MLFRDLIQNNFWLKLLSIALATVIWFVIRSSQDLSFGATPVLNPSVQETAALPVTVLTHPADARIFKITPERVVVTVTGESAVLRKYSRKDYRAYVDLSELGAREPNAEELVKIHLPPEVVLLKTAPQAVRIEQVSP